MSTSGIKGFCAYVLSLLASVFTQDALSVIYQLLGCVCVVYSIFNFSASRQANKAEESKNKAIERANQLQAKLTTLKINEMENRK